jgi:hypothetical protein
MAKIEIVYVGRRLTADDKLKRFWAHADTPYKEWTFSGKGLLGLSGCRPGAVFSIAQDKDKAYTVSGKDGPTFLRRWPDEDKVAEWEADDVANYAAYTAAKKANATMKDEAIVELLRPIARAMGRVDSFGRAAIRLRVLACLDKAIGYR